MSSLGLLHRERLVKEPATGLECRAQRWHQRPMQVVEDEDDVAAAREFGRRVGLEVDELAGERQVQPIGGRPHKVDSLGIAIDRVDGMTKLLIEPETERILGVGIVGSGAGELIAEGVLAIEMGATASDLKLTIHAHPTLSETVMEAAEMFFGQATHVYKPKRKQ